MFSGKGYFAGQKPVFSYLPFTESWRSKLCLTYFSFCCSRCNIVKHSGRTLETHVFHYEPRLQQEKRWAKTHSLMPGLDISLSELFRDLVNFSKTTYSGFLTNLRHQRHLFSIHLKEHIWFVMYHLVTIWTFREFSLCRWKWICPGTACWWLFRNNNHNMQTINSARTNTLFGFRCLKL